MINLKERESSDEMDATCHCETERSLYVISKRSLAEREIQNRAARRLLHS